MLEIQKFIRDHDNWQELLSSEPYNLKISFDEDYVLFKYDQISSDFSEEICREARGLILDASDGFKVVRMAFKKFFNFGESYAADINWNNCSASEKMDGSLMSVWYSHDKWHLSTNGTIDAYKAPISGAVVYNNFGELFESVLPMTVFKGNRLENLCFTFELVSPFNRVVIEYKESEVYLLSVRRMDTLEEISDDKTLDSLASMLGVKRPHKYNLNKREDYQELVDSMDDSHEGIVVCDNNLNRVKIKTLHYFELHKMAHNGNVPMETIVDIVRTNEVEEFLSYFSQYSDVVHEIQKRVDMINKAIEQIERDVAEWKNFNIIDDLREKRKVFALWVQEQDHPTALYFKAYEGADIKNFVSEMTNSKFIRFFNIN